MDGTMTSGQPVPKTRSFSAATRGVLAGAAVLLPSLTLLPLGGLYLWEHGLLIWWAVGALACVVLISTLLRILLKPADRAQPIPAVTVEAGSDPHWSDEETLAWKDVLDIAARVEVDEMNSAQYFVDLGQTTLNAVAKRLHPEKSDALWRFTLPEALAIVERVSRRLGGFVVESVPLGDTLTVAQLLAAYRWRGMFDVAERAYDIWRIVRIVNPATAVTNEARERLSRAVYNYGKEHVSRRIAEAFVEEVGRAAIDLYGGRLMIAQKLATQPATESSDPLQELSSRHVTLTTAVAGSNRSDRLAVASLLDQEAERRRLSARNASEGTLTALGEPVAIHADSDDQDGITDELQAADFIVWIITSANREKDPEALASLLAKAKAKGQPLFPVVLPVVLHDTAEEAARFKDAARQDAEALTSALGVRAAPLTTIVGLDVSPTANIEELTNKIAERMPLARRGHILRVLGEAKRSSSWSKSARQAMKAAGALTRAVSRRRRQP